MFPLQSSSAVPSNSIIEYYPRLDVIRVDRDNEAYLARIVLLPYHGSWTAELRANGRVVFYESDSQKMFTCQLTGDLWLRDLALFEIIETIADRDANGKMTDHYVRLAKLRSETLLRAAVFSARYADADAEFRMTEVGQQLDQPACS